MHQLQLPITGTITYSQLREQCSRQLAEEGPKLTNRISGLLVSLEAETRLDRAQKLLQGINEAALRLAALDPAWIGFSDAAFEQVILPSKTVAPAAIRTLRDLFNERTNENARDNDL